MGKRRLKRLLPVTAVLGLALAGCETFEVPGFTPETPPEPVAAADDPESLAPTEPTVEDTATVDEAGEDLTEEPTVAPVVEPEVAALPPEPQIDDDPDQLMGLDRTGVDTLLGRPLLIRREPPAEIWQYRAEDCIFDVFLYEEAGNHRVTYLEARDRTAQRIETRGCLNALLRARLDDTAG